MRRLVSAAVCDRSAPAVVPDRGYGHQIGASAVYFCERVVDEATLHGVNMILSTRISVLPTARRFPDASFLGVLLYPPTEYE